MASSNPDFEVRVLMAKGKRAAAAYIRAVQSAWMWSDSASHHLNQVLDNLLNPANIISEWETIEWIKWLSAGGCTPDEFASTVRTFDNATTCGLVWTPNFVAYRCRTCGISPCMSLCTECFKKGNHQRHDFNMFLSQAGGACDCGDTSVMKETGFCDRHGPNKSVNKDQAPTDLMCVAQAMMPRIIQRLVQHLREQFETNQTNRNPIHDADPYITMLLDFNNMGGLMRRVMTTALTNPQQYRLLNEVPNPPLTDYHNYLSESRRVYQEALMSLPNPMPMEDYKDCPSLQEKLEHKTFLEELVFWTVKFEFPQKIVCLLLNMLPDPDYKEALTRAFVLHYSRISKMLENSRDPDMLSNRVVHVSVQLFSNEGLALRMTEQLNLLHVMVVSLKYMMSKILIQNSLHDSCHNFHFVVDCGQPVMKDHCYWPLVSDLNNVLSHRPVAWRFMCDDSLLEMWFAFLSMFQGMNVNQREMTQHVEFEPNTYYAAFSAELEASAYPMWALVSHLVDHSTANLTRRVIKACLAALQEWLDAINYTNSYMEFALQVSFHIPLHRYLAVFLCKAVAKQGIALNEVLPSSDMLNMLMIHPLRVQVAFYEIINGMWVRNGLQIKGQAMTYIQCNFCNSMVDADLYLLQIICTRLPAESFLNLLIDKFHIRDWTSLDDIANAREFNSLGDDQEAPMVESMLTFLATLISVRTNLGLSETGLNRLEMITLLCMSDKTHSQLMELMPERCGTSQSRDFEALLAEVADYRAPALEATGNMQQGMYVPKAAVWQTQYDPIHVLLRAVHRRDFQTSLDRYADYARHANKLKKGSPWPPFRTPSPCNPAYDDPRIILRSRVFHALTLIALKKAADNHSINENGMALIIFMLEQAIEVNEKVAENTSMCPTAPPASRQITDTELINYFPTDSLFENLRTPLDKVLLRLVPDFNTTACSPRIVSSDSDNDSHVGIDDEESPLSGVFMLEESEWAEPEAAQWAVPEVNVGSNLMVYQSDPDDSPNVYRRVAIAGPSRPVAQFPALPAPEAPSTSTANADDGMMQVALPSYLRLELFGNAQPTPSTSTEIVPSHLESESPSPTLPSSDNNALDVANYPLVPYGSHPARGSGVKMYYKRQGVDARNTERYRQVNESIISLLLKLHSQLSGEPNSYNPEDAAMRADPEMLGDGTFYIGRCLDKIAAADDACKDYIAECRNQIWPQEEDCEEIAKRKEQAEKEARRQRAKARQQKMMEEFANKQKQFMESNKENDSSNMEWSSSEATSEPLKQEYDCVICNQSSPSTEKKPMGLVVLVQATSVLGHRRKAPNTERSVLPTCDEERDKLSKDDTLLAEFDRRCEELDDYFHKSMWIMSVNIGWEGGVYVQTCGHHLHLDCLKSYINSLRSQQRQQILAPDKGEYFCPLCRQLANSVLPLTPQLGDCSQVVRTRPTRMHDILTDVTKCLVSPAPTNLARTNLWDAMAKAMEDMSSSTQLKPIFKHNNDEEPRSRELFLFVTSVARTNLEIELVQRGGSLVTTTQEPPNPLLPKRDCIVPLLHVLGSHASELSTSVPAHVTFQQLYDAPLENTLSAYSLMQREVPLMLKDPIALLLQFVLLLPVHLDPTSFTTVVKMVYNLAYYQIVAQISCGLTTAERRKAIENASTSHIDSLGAALRLIDKTLFQSTMYKKGDNTQVNMVALEQQVQKLCLPFLRIAGLLRHHLYNQPLPDIRAPESEFVRLVYYLELVTEGMNWECFNSAVALNWPSETDSTVHHRAPTKWCSVLLALVCKKQFVAASSLLCDQHITWLPPRLLQLPREYEKIFTYYHERACLKCHHVPTETSICLLCGTIVCLKQNCCKQQNVCEAVSHSLECGSGTGVFLVVTSTYIIVIRGKRACLWGSLYLDDFEEEDRDLKRGKPLYLSKDRYQLLEQQWLAHRFDHTKKTWVWHRDAL